MAATRRDITTNQIDADRFVQATLALKAEASGLRASDLGIGPGPLAADRELSTWDLFIVWHVWAMQQISVDGRRNAAHMGPVFLPWHRWYLLVLEAQMRRVLGVGPDDFGCRTGTGPPTAATSPRAGNARRRPCGPCRRQRTTGRSARRRWPVHRPSSSMFGSSKVRVASCGRPIAASGATWRRRHSPATPGRCRRRARRRHVRPLRLGHVGQLVPQSPRRVGAGWPGDAQPGSRLGGRGHGAGLVAERSDLLPQPLPRRQAVGHLAAGVGRPHLRPDRPVSAGRSAVPPSTGRSRLFDPHDQPTGRSPRSRTSARSTCTSDRQSATTVPRRRPTSDSTIPTRP